MNVLCFCGSLARLADNSEVYGRSYGNGKVWLCTRYPECEGRVGAHPNGRPLGSLSDNATREWRIQVHANVDPLWKDLGLTGKAKQQRRGSVYGWLASIMHMTSQECHIANFTSEECLEALEQIALHPYEERAS